MNSIVLKNMKYFLFFIFLLSILNIGLCQHSSYKKKDNISDHHALLISDIELISSLSLITTGVLVTRLIDENRQGIEIPCFVFGTIFFIESRRLKRTVYNPNQVRKYKKYNK